MKRSDFISGKTRTKPTQKQMKKAYQEVHPFDRENLSQEVLEQLARMEMPVERTHVYTNPEQIYLAQIREQREEQTFHGIAQGTPSIAMGQSSIGIGSSYYNYGCSRCGKVSMTPVCDSCKGRW